MEYIFGNDEQCMKRTLLTKGEEHTHLNGFCEIVREYEDCTITDSFYVVRKINNNEDADGNCYDWYEIDNHSRNTDFSPLLQKQNQELQSENELLKAQIKAQSSRSDFMENCIAEMAMQIYST